MAALNVDFVEVDLTTSDDAIEKIKALGYLAAPVVVVGEDQHWTGYEPEKISALALTA